MTTTATADCHAGQGRYAATAALAAAALSVVALVVVPAVLVRAAGALDDVCFIAILSPIVAFAVYLPANASFGLEQRGRMLTARTLFGRRTVDLGRLVGVRLLEIPVQPGPLRWLLLTDEHGVQLAVPEARIDHGRLAHEIVTAVRRARSGRVRVSRAARERLDLEGRQEPGWLRGELASLLWAVAVLAVLGGTGMGTLALSLTLAGAT
ncbi:hypothetical protein G5C51_14845 [Streptomyces sp. A7024]|uniref:PH domain-containing protein n=1 Tax=Streptomyces coryli TaxID=1128680 RepID=A0A6G4U1R0_9ACTN|nr:hypothetical protein [Streptomyces coryli]NGN65171.1 hypothetical protein [Streptomyces coryli]